MLGGSPDAGTAGCTHHHGDLGFATKHVFHLAGLVIQLIQGHADEIDKHQLNDRSESHGGGPYRCSDDGTFGNGGVFHPFVTKLVQETCGYAKNSAVNADILTGDIDIGITLHFYLVGVV